MLLGLSSGLYVGLAQAQQTAEASGGATTTIRAESRLVLVDVVVTDKNGNYVEDLSKADFRVYQDHQEQKISSFSLEKSGVNGQSQKRYFVLFFDDDSMQAIDQSRASLAAMKFLDANAHAGNYFAILDYAGTLQLAQGFTNDAERLKKIAAMPKMSLGYTGSGSLDESMFASYDSYSNRNSLLALRSVARSLSSLPGRKSIIWLTAGFPMTPSHQAEMIAVINACNKANVAVYPLDVRALTGGVAPAGKLVGPTLFPDSEHLYQAALYDSITFSDEERPGAPRLIYVQAKPGGGGSTGGTGGRPPGGTTGTTGTRPGGTTYQHVLPLNAGARTIVPPLPPSTMTNQAVMYAVAIGTGGFVIVNTNDLLGGMERVGKEQNEYYILGYVPPEGSENACHTLQVRVDRSGYNVRSRSGYCATKPVDFLAGKPIAQQLEQRAMGSQAGEIPGSVATPFFYTSPETARVNLVMEIPGKSIQFEKVKGKYHGVINVLAVALKADGTVAARFSDTAELNLGKNDMDDFASRPYHYENHFYLAGGQYTMKLAVSSGDKFGKFEMPLVVDHYDPKDLSISGLAISKQFYKVSDLSTALDAQLLQDRTPLVTQGLQIVPSSSNRFKTSDRVAIYLEVYEPQVAGAAPPKVGLRLRITDEKTGKSQLEAGVPDTASSVIPGNPVIPMGVPLPVERLQPGTYVVELRATDSAGQSFPIEE